MMDVKASSKKIANNILEFLVDPSAFPLERRLYFRPEEILMNESFEKAKKESQQAYGDQRHNSDFYPHRPVVKREASTMERKTLIASLDVLSQEFIETDPMAKDLRTMAYAIANMSDEELETRAAGNPWIEHMNKVRKSNPGKSFKEIASLAKKTFKKAEETSEKEASEKALSDDSWSKEASEAIQKALVAEVGEACDDKGKKEEEKEAGKIPGVPDGTGPKSDTPACPKTEKEAAKEEPKKEAAKEKEAAEEEPKKEAAKEEPKKKAAKEEPKKEAAEEEPKKKAAKEEPKKEAAEEPEPEKEAKEEPTEVDTQLLKSSTDFGGIQLGAGMVTMDDIGDLSETEQKRLDLLFK